MMSYRFRRRAFMAAMSGGVGLKIMLRNLESAAQGMRSPPRLLVTHWPVGIVAGQSDALFKPNAGSSVVGSPALKPFADAGLSTDMTVVRGLSTADLALNGGGGEEGGTVVLVTGRATGGTRANCCEGDDSFAAGPSFDQILLQNVPALQRPGGPGYANSIADSRTDFGEISTQVLSYATSFQSVNTYNNQGVASEAIPLRPVLSPLQQYLNLFGGLAPGMPGTGGGAGNGGAGGQGGGSGGSPPAADATLKKLVGKKSVLDFAVEELNQLQRLAPSDARNRLSIHTDAVVAAETSIVNTINQRYPVPGGSAGSGGSTGTGGAGGGAGAGGSGGGDGGPSYGACTTKPTPPPDVVGMADPNNGRGTGNNFGNDVAKQDDAPIHAQVGQAHFDVLKAAFICDLIRVGTFSWSPGSNHVGFALDPTNTTPYQHHPRSHRIGSQQTTIGSTPDQLQIDAHFLYNVELWYFSRMAEIMSGWKNTVDGYGNNLLDFTCVPFLTEVQACGHERSNLPAMIIGGKQLGFIHNIYKTGTFTINQFWGTIGQAVGYTPTDAPFAPPISGLWSQP